MTGFELIASVGTGDAPLTDGELEALRAALWGLLAKRVRAFTMGDSTSVPVERAEAILESTCCVLHAHLNDRGLSARALLAGDPAAVFDDALDTVTCALVAARALYERAKRCEPPVPSRSWRDTLREIGAFFTRYDFRAAAQEVPCCIDYQLCLTVPDATPGVWYILAYLRRFLIEAEWLSGLNAQAAARVLRRFCPDAEELLVNLYEPVMANAVGAAMAGLDARVLDVPSGARLRLEGELRALDAPAVRARLLAAAQRAAQETGASLERPRRYMTDAALALAPRMLAALQNGGLSRIFIPLYEGASA